MKNKSLIECLVRQKVFSIKMLSMCNRLSEQGEKRVKTLSEHESERSDFLSGKCLVRLF